MVVGEGKGRVVWDDGCVFEVWSSVSGPNQGSTDARRCFLPLSSMGLIVSTHAVQPSVLEGREEVFSFAFVQFQSPVPVRNLAMDSWMVGRGWSTPREGGPVEDSGGRVSRR